MNKNNRFRDTAMKIGAAAGRLDGKAHKAAQKAVKALKRARTCQDSGHTAEASGTT